MTVVRPNSISGITSITAQTDTINFFKSDGSLAGLLLNGTNFNTTSGVSTFNILKVGTATTLDSSGINITGVTTVSAGSASAPSITPSGDSNTGIFFPAADTVAIAEGGVEALRVDNNGNINFDNGSVFVDAVNNRLAVGTTIPDGPFHAFKGSAGAVTASANGSVGVFESSFSDGISILVPDSSLGSIFWGSPSSNRFAEIDGCFNNNRLDIGTRNAGAELAFYSGNFSECARFTAGGRVGIASTTPTSKLEVQGDVRVVGVITATSDVKIGTKSVATTGKAIAMAMVFS